MLSAIQIKMGRTAIGWGVRELAEAANISPNTVSRIESGKDAMAGTITKIQRMLESKGVTFTADGCVCPPKELP